MGVTDRVRRGVILRLELVKPFARTWPQAMALGLHPVQVATTAHTIHQIAD